jgi:hypothetical protein
MSNALHIPMREDNRGKERLLQTPQKLIVV